MSVALCGFGQAITWANGISWANQYLTINASVFLIFFASGGLGGFAFDYSVGVLFNFDISAYGYFMTAHAAFYFVLFVALEIVAKVFVIGRTGKYIAKVHEQTHL